MSSPPPPPPPPQPVRHGPVVPVMPRLVAGGGEGGGGGVAGISPSIVIIAVIIVVMLIASVSIHYFIRHLCRSPAAAAPAPPLPLVAQRAPPGTAAPAPGVRGKEVAGAAEVERLIERLPLVTLSSTSPAAAARDCAVCQSAFERDDELRLLPACRHAFHSGCVDPWLRSNPSCPLCRASIALPHPPLPDLTMRAEVGSVSSRRASSAAADVPRSYPLPGRLDAEYLVEEDLEVVLHNPKPKDEKPNQLAPPAAVLGPATAVLGQVACGEPSRQVERGPPSGSTSFNSARSSERWSSRWSNRWSSRWSGRWSSRYDAGSVTAAATAEWWWDMDGGAAPTVARRREAEEGGGFYGFLRWLSGAY